MVHEETRPPAKAPKLTCGARDPLNGTGHDPGCFDLPPLRESGKNDHSPTPPWDHPNHSPERESDRGSGEGEGRATLDKPRLAGVKLR